MKNIRFRRYALIVLVVCLVLAGVAAWWATRTPASAFDGISQDTPTEALLQRGEYVARLADCVACHSTPSSAPFAGGLEMATPMGSIFATNITPDKATGIGNYSLADFERALRQGVTPDGRRLYPAMPYPSYVKLEDDDIRALYAYFMHTVAPVHQENRPSGIPWPLNMRWPLAFWNTLFTDSGSYTPDPSKDAQWNRGAYIVQGPGHCGSCHTPRGLAFNEKGLTERQPEFLAGALLDGWYAPSLRNDHNTGLGRWSEADVVQFLKTGRNQHAVVFGSMTEAFNNSTQFFTDADLQAVAHYLKSLPGDPARDGAPWRYEERSAKAPGSGEQPSRVAGATLFANKCASCHGADGRGQSPWMPPLAGATSALAKENASAINIVLNGAQRVVAAGVPDAYRMPALRNQLSDKEIADVLSFVRSSWGNHGEPVPVEDVATLRKHTDPASPTPIILQMR